MEFLISATTDIGTAKSTNQDAFTVKTLSTPMGKMAVAVLCDGMGGLACGEVASASVIRAFDAWVRQDLPLLCGADIDPNVIFMQWNGIVQSQNEVIRAYGEQHGIQLGTTVVVLLLTQTRYYLLNVGDSRIYEIGDTVVQLTNDQTLVAREVANGNLTPEQAETDSRRNILLQCVGASEDVHPEIAVGDTREGAVYLLCSDGFRHEISVQELYEKLCPAAAMTEEQMQQNTTALIELVKQRGENDNITAALVRSV